MYDYALGGMRNCPADRRALDEARLVFPRLSQVMWANRGFHQRAAIWMARQGISQFVDLGCGLPSPASNTHQAVQAVNPETRVAYVDHDPVVASDAGALLADGGKTTVVQADVRDPASLLAALHLDGLIEMARPIGLLCTAVMEFVADDRDPWGCLGRIVSPLAPGSYLAFSHLTSDRVPLVPLAALVSAYRDTPERLYPRGKGQVARFVDGLELVPPYEGAAPELCRIGLWGAEDPAVADDFSSRWWWAAVARR
jgi:hypothetical protein